MFRIGDFEPVIGILNLLNKTMNDRMNAIEQFVQNLLIFINCELKDESEYDKIRQKGFLTLKNKLPNGGNSDIKMITETLNQDQIQSYVDSLKSMLFEIVGIPDRKTTGGGSGDTGSAVELRDGWQDLEMVARNKQLQYEFSERKSLGVTLEILHSIEKENVTIEERDVEIKFSRNKNTNLLVKTQGLMNLMETKILTPSEALKVVDIINDIEEEVKKAQEFWEDDFANKTVENNNENLIIEDNIDQLTNKGGEEDAFARNNKQDK
jgi:SPP1 family phage portal protein